MRRPFREIARSRHVALATFPVLLLAAGLLLSAGAHADGEVAVEGRLSNGTAGASAPAGLEVFLHIISDTGEVDISSARTDAAGSFGFPAVAVDDGASYTLTTSYQDILYSTRVEPPALDELVELTIYDVTQSISDVTVSADVMLIRTLDEGGRLLTVFEVLQVENAGDRTFVPDLEQPGLMNFMRFSLHTEAQGLEVSSDLPGGEVLNVGSGFALTAPVTPGAHQVTYSYRIPYEGDRTELDHSFPMGAGTFRILVEDGLGQFRSGGSMVPLPPAESEDRSYVVWGVSDLSAGDRLSVELVDLPQPTARERLGDALTDGSYLKVGIPSAVGAVLAGILLYALFFRRREGSGVANLALASSPAQMSSEVGTVPSTSGIEQRRALVDAIAGLDDRYERGELSVGDYDRSRQELKDRLLSVTPATREPTQGGNDAG